MEGVPVLTLSKVSRHNIQYPVIANLLGALRSYDCAVMATKLKFPFSTFSHIICYKDWEISHHYEVCVCVNSFEGS